MTTKPKNIVVIENQLAIKWSDGKESFVGCEKLRLSCPCANCSGEKDIFGNISGGKKSKLIYESLILNKVVLVGSYAIRLFWKDGHSNGIYTFQHLKGLSE